MLFWVFVLVVLLALAWIFRATTPVAGADTVFYGYGFYDYSYDRDQVRWSVYEHRLVSGDVYYSPYAFQYGHSGLVNKEFRYSPYAFGNGQTGLISKYDARPYNQNQAPAHIFSPVVVVVQLSPDIDPVFRQEAEKQRIYRENVEARRKMVEQRKRQMAERGLITKK